MFVVKLFATSAIALGDWSVDWGLNEATMREVVAPDRLPLKPPRIIPPTEPAVADDEPPIADDEPPVADDESAQDDVDAETADDESPDDRTEHSSMRKGARRLIYFWKSLVAALAAGYQAAFLWVAAVGVYLLLRRDIDGVQLSEVYIDQADEYGLPPLADEATAAVPEIAPGAPAQPGDTAPA
jgi:hypothetical protein